METEKKTPDPVEEWLKIKSLYGAIATLTFNPLTKTDPTVPQILTYIEQSMTKDPANCALSEFGQSVLIALGGNLSIPHTHEDFQRLRQLQQELFDLHDPVCPNPDLHSNL